MNKLIPILFVVFLAWCFVCYRWYVCGIKELCEEVQPVASVAKVEPNAVPIITPIESPKGNLVSVYQDTTIITDASTSQTLDSLVLQAQEYDSLLITGVYWGNENEVIAQSRAQSIAQMLKSRGVEQVLNTGTRYLDDDTTREIAKAARFTFSAVQKSKEEEKITPPTFIDKIVIRFSTASATPLENTRLEQQLNEIVKAAAQDNVKVIIVGHTDNTGTTESNQKYGIARARKVANLLKAAGLSENKMEVSSKGESEPVDSNDTPEGRAKNRRVEVLISKN